MGLCRRVASAAIAPLLLAVLSGCAASPAQGRVTSTLMAAAVTTATAASTTTLNGLPRLPTAHVASGACGEYLPNGIAYTPADGLVVTQFSSLGSVTHPDTLLPSSQSAAPIQRPSLSSTGAGPFIDTTTAAVNPYVEGGSGYVIVVCNPSSQAHTVSAVQVSIASISPATSPTQAWHSCGGSYVPGSGVEGNACGGMDLENEYMHAGFAPDAQVGASVTATQTGSNSNGMGGSANYGPLPVTLEPGQTLSVEVGVTQPSAAGYYTYAFGLTVDGATTGVVAYSLKTLFDPQAIEWSAQNCQAAAYQSQIAQMPTPTTGTLFVICPPQ